MSNPLNALLPKAPEPGTLYRWGYVTNTSPFEVILDNETSPIRPSRLVDAVVGERVFVLVESRRATVLGKVPEPEPAWQSWTPVIIGTTTNPTMGNSTVVGRYLQVGKAVTLNIYIQFGSTFSPGAGAYTIPTLPVAASPDYWQNLQVACSGMTPSGDLGGYAKIEGSSGILRIHVYPGGTAARHEALGGTTPVVAASGGRLLINGTYEAA